MDVPAEAAPEPFEFLAAGDYWSWTAMGRSRVTWDLIFNSRSNFPRMAP